MKWTIDDAVWTSELVWRLLQLVWCYHSIVLSSPDGYQVTFLDNVYVAWCCTFVDKLITFKGRLHRFVVGNIYTYKQIFIIEHLFYKYPSSIFYSKLTNPSKQTDPFELPYCFLLLGGSVCRSREGWSHSRCEGFLSTRDLPSQPPYWWNSWMDVTWLPITASSRHRRPGKARQEVANVSLTAVSRVCFHWPVSV